MIEYAIDVSFLIILSYINYDIPDKKVYINKVKESSITTVQLYVDSKYSLDQTLS